MARKKDCAFVAKAGKNVGPGSGPYHICLSTRQAQALFGRALSPSAVAERELGCGAWACVWKGKRGRVVKITRDPDDIAAFRALRGMSRVRKIYQDFELVDAGIDAKSGKPIQLWAQIGQEVHPLPAREKRWLRDTLCRMRISLLIDTIAHRGGPRGFKASKVTHNKVDKACTELPRGEVQACRRFGHSLVNAYEKMYRRGVSWIDMHEGNIGVDSRGNWVAIDLGFSDVPLSERVPQLQGPRSTLRRGRRR